MTAKKRAKVTPKPAATSAAFDVVTWPIAHVVPYANNPRTNEHAIDTVAASLKRFGWRQPLVVDEAGVLIVGHTRHAAALSLGWTEVPVHVAVGLDADDARAYRLMDNRSHEDSDWEQAKLAGELKALLANDFDMLFTGFDEQELEGLIGTFGDPDGTGGDNAPISDSELLRLVNVTIADPSRTVKRGEVWALGPHVLYCTDLFTGWPEYTTELKDPEQDVLVPFPGPVVALTQRATEKRLVLVQPDGYIAGHILDRYADVHGASTVAQRT